MIVSIVQLAFYLWCAWKVNLDRNVNGSGPWQFVSLDHTVKHSMLKYPPCTCFLAACSHEIHCIAYLKAKNVSCQRLDWMSMLHAVLIKIGYKFAFNLGNIHHHFITKGHCMFGPQHAHARDINCVGPQRLPLPIHFNVESL